MYGPPTENGNRSLYNSTDTTTTPIDSIEDSTSTSIGLIPRTVQEIFKLAKLKTSILDFTVHCSFVQIYNENLYDMLRYLIYKKKK
jgi:hypothetical protein